MENVWCCIQVIFSATASQSRTRCYQCTLLIQKSYFSTRLWGKLSTITWLQSFCKNEGFMFCEKREPPYFVKNAGPYDHDNCLCSMKANLVGYSICTLHKLSPVHHSHSTVICYQILARQIFFHQLLYLFCKNWSFDFIKIVGALLFTKTVVTYVHGSIMKLIDSQ